MYDLPFILFNNHKILTKFRWKRCGLIMDNFEEIYNNYIIATNCDLCGKEFTNTRDRHMEHNHQTGEFRNIVCRSCNMLKSDVKTKTNNTSGYLNIHKKPNKQLKQGFNWVFQVKINGKSKTIKSSVNLDKLVKFAEKWKKDNNYHT